MGRELRASLGAAKQAGIDLLPVGDFAGTTMFLTTSLLLERIAGSSSGLATVPAWTSTLCSALTAVARASKPAAAAEMTNGFKHNYHYIVPEFSKASSSISHGHSCAGGGGRLAGAGDAVKPVLLGPVAAYLWLGKVASRLTA